MLRRSRFVRLRFLLSSEQVALFKLHGYGTQERLGQLLVRLNGKSLQLLMRTGRVEYTALTCRHQFK